MPDTRLKAEHKNIREGHSSFAVVENAPSPTHVHDSKHWAAIQRRGSILAWVVILSVYGADTIAIDLALSVLIS
jgi:hypothetical protein